MMMTGTASPTRTCPTNTPDAPVTSDLTCEEMWNLTSMGFLPLKLRDGHGACIRWAWPAAWRPCSSRSARGEIKELTTLIYDAREHAIGLIRDEAEDIGADDVVGIKTHIHEMGSLIEFMAIGTAVKKFPGIVTTRRRTAAAGHHQGQGHVDQRPGRLRPGRQAGPARRQRTERHFQFSIIN